MNAAKLEKSDRLQRALGVLRAARRSDVSGGWVTTRSLIRRAHVCAVNSVVAELRANGAVIEAQVKLIGQARRWSYRLTRAPEGWE